MDIQFCNADGTGIMDLRADVVPAIGDRVELRGEPWPATAAWHEWTAYTVTGRHFRHEGRTLAAFVTVEKAP